MIKLYEVFYMVKEITMENPKRFYFANNEVEAGRITGTASNVRFIERFYKGLIAVVTYAQVFKHPPRATYFDQLLSITEPAYSAEDAAKQVEIRFKDDKDFIKICQVKPRMEIKWKFLQTSGQFNGLEFYIPNWEKVRISFD